MRLLAVLKYFIQNKWRIFRHIPHPFVTKFLFCRPGGAGPTVDHQNQGAGRQPSPGAEYPGWAGCRRYPEPPSGRDGSRTLKPARWTGSVWRFIQTFSSERGDPLRRAAAGDRRGAERPAGGEQAGADGSAEPDWIGPGGSGAAAGGAGGPGGNGPAADPQLPAGGAEAGRSHRWEHLGSVGFRSNGSCRNETDRILSRIWTPSEPPFGANKTQMILLIFYYEFSSFHFIIKKILLMMHRYLFFLDVWANTFQIYCIG